MNPLERPTMYFIGVTTASSSILKIFPLWAEILGVDEQLIGHDLPLDASVTQYREIVNHIKSDPLARGLDHAPIGGVRGVVQLDGVAVANNIHGSDPSSELVILCGVGFNPRKLSYRVG